MSSTVSRAALAALLLALASAGCSSDRNELARVGNVSITLEDFERNARDNLLQYPGLPAAAKNMLLQDLVRRELLIAGARRQGADTTAEARAILRDTERRALASALFARLAPQSVGVSDAEVARYHGWRNIQAETQLIYTSDRMSIRAAQAALRRGEAFDQVADRYNLPGILPPGGNVGFATPGALLPPLDEAVRTQPIGVIGGPFETPQGWFLVRILRREPRQQRPLDQEAASLRESLRQRKQRAVLSAALAGLRRAYALRLEPGAPQALFMRFQEERMAIVENRTPVAIGDRSRVLARFDGHGIDSGTFTFGDAVDDLASLASDRPDATSIPAIEAWIESHALQRIVQIEAKRRHLGEEPEIARAIRKRFDDWLLEGIYAATVAGTPAGTLADGRALFESNPAAYTQLRRARLVEAMFADSAQAAAFVAQAGSSGAPLRAAAEAQSPAPAVTDIDVRFPSPDPEWTALVGRILYMTPGPLTGPLRSRLGWRVLQFIDREVGAPKWEELPPQLQQQFADAATEGARDRRLGALTDSLARVLRPTIHADRLAKSPWPPPQILNVGT